jgi:hypothetical protein
VEENKFLPETGFNITLVMSCKSSETPTSFVWKPGENFREWIARIGTWYVIFLIVAAVYGAAIRE